ncbi:hypothetical protein AAVH_11856 [Aphelenchoides avenae]|nr:hypothetical protein AAVH_11856 [Aphelenchus avenae]
MQEWFAVIAVFTFMPQPRAWFEADIECGRLGGTLTSVHSPMENSLILGQFSGTCFKGFWLGGASEVPGQWRCTDGSMFSFTNWAAG